MSQPSDPGSEPHADAFQAIDARLESLDSDRYRRNATHVLEGFHEWLAEHRDVPRVVDVTTTDCRRWVQRYLRVRVRDPDDRFSAASAQTYHDVVRAFFTWCVRDDRLASNPMDSARVAEELPEDTAEPDRQFWPDAARRRLLDHVDRDAQRALAADEGVERAFRDRVVAYLLADTAARGAELFAVSGDDRRNGITWRDVDLERGTVTVLGKNRSRQPVQLPKTTAEKLSRYRRLLDAPADWPVVPTMDASTKYRRVRTVLGRRGWEAERVEQALEAADSVDSVLREHGIAPPALTTEGARRRMKALSDDAGVDVDGEYLKPHGGRRALGHKLYWEVSAEAAQSVLRHASIETTHESYQDARAGQLSETVDELLYGTQAEADTE